MPQIIEVPGMGRVEFPDGMSDKDIVAAIQKNATRKPNQAAMNPEVDTPFGKIQGETSGGFNPAAALIKAGGALESVNRGIQQAKWGPVDWAREKMGLKPTGISDLLAKASQDEKQPMQDLQDVHPGSTLIGDMSLAAGAPWRALPAIAASEYGSPTERLARGGATFLGGKLAEKGGQIASRAFTKSEESAVASALHNAKKDGAIAEGVEAGYKTIPSVSNGPFAGRVVEGLTGTTKAKQLASVQNQPVTDALVRKELALPENAPLSHETMKAVRAKAAEEGYEPIRQVPRMETDPLYHKQSSELTSAADNASKDFGDLVQSDVKPLAEALKAVKSFTGDTAVDAVRSLREKSSALYANGDKPLGKAYRQGAEIIEDQIERGLSKDGKDGAVLLQNFRAARARMAQSFDAEKALREGEGVIDARVLGRLYEKNPDRMSGNFAKIGKTAAAMPDVMAVPKAGWSNPVTAVDSWGGSIGSILAGNPSPLALPVVRAAGRYGLMSGPGQNLLTKPKYKPNSLLGGTSKALDNEMAPWIAGLLGYEASR